MTESGKCKSQEDPKVDKTNQKQLTIKWKTAKKTGKLEAVLNHVL